MIDDGASDLPGFNIPFDKNVPLGTSGYNVLMEQYLKNGYSSYYDPIAQGKKWSLSLMFIIYNKRFFFPPLDYILIFFTLFSFMFYYYVFFYSITSYMTINDIKIKNKIK